MHLSINRLCIALLAALLTVPLGSPPTPAAAQPGGEGAGGGPNVSCARCIVVDEDGTVLWARNRADRFPNASTTKMTTALLTVARTSPREVVTVSSYAASIGGGGEDLSAGGLYTVRDLLYALLLTSSNEAAVALAEHVAGSEGAFVASMNRFARRLGARRTHYSNPHGLDAEEHYSSAADLALIGRAVLNDPFLAEIVATPRAVIQTPTGSTEVENRNLLLESYTGAIGIKTGRTLGAGNVLVAAARRGRHTLIAVAMNSFDTFADAGALLDFGFAERRRLARTGTLLERGATVGALIFDGVGSTSVVAATELEGVVPRAGEPIDVVFVPARDLSLPLAAGDVVGTVKVTTPDATVAIDAIATGALEESDNGWGADALGSLVGLFGGALHDVFA